MPVWTMLGHFPGRTLKADVNSIICFGYKELGKKTTKCLNAWDFRGWGKDVNNDRKLCEAIYDIVKDYDGVVTQNGKKFDWPFIETRLLLHGLPRLPKLQHFDTKIAAKSLYFVSNSLKEMGRLLTDEEKMPNDGWILWEKVRKRDPRAMRKITAYCKQDVRTLEAVFERLRKYARGTNMLPNHNLFLNHAIECCPECGSFNHRSNGNRYTSSSSYRRLACKDCGTPFQGALIKRLPPGSIRRY